MSKAPKNPRLMRNLQWPALILGLAFAAGLHAADDEQPVPSPWGDFVEQEFPFVGTVLDAREIEGEWPQETGSNLIPRGIVFNLDQGVHVCFDPDLLRIALIWQAEDDGQFLSMDSMAAGSYHNAGKKAPGGQGQLPKPVGKVFVANGIYPGVRLKSDAPWADPRKHSDDPSEVGLGPLAATDYEWQGLKVKDGEATLRYRVGDTQVSERLELAGSGSDLTLVRKLTLEGGDTPLQFIKGYTQDGSMGVEEVAPKGTQVIEVALSGAKSLDLAGESKPEAWSQDVTVSAPEDFAIKTRQPYVIEEIPAPVPNPWKRNVRLSGLDFFSDGRAALCTFDGDIWIAENFAEDLQEVKWTRFGAGLNEPMSLHIVKDQIYIFDRGGIWKILDTDSDGQADDYQMFCNLFAQTAETREFANDMQKKPDGGFIIAKAGQSDTTQGIHNGKIIEVAPDGKSFKIIAGGLRQPFIGYDPELDLITSSDQQGHWVPSTPIHAVQQDAHYGFIPTKIDGIKQPKAITDPFVWIPHFVNQSGASQVTVRDERFGPMSEQLLHLGFNRPELFRIYRDGDQGAVASFLSGFDTGTLKMAVNPKDGQLYICGFKIWGTVASEVTGFYRVRYTGEGILETPAWVESAAEGVLIRFDFPVDEAIAMNLPNYNVDRWNYKRSSGYGSGHYKLDGEPGQESLTPSSVYVSEDKKAIFVGIPDMKTSDQLRVTYRLPIPSELPEVRSVYLTVHHLEPVDLAAAGFANKEVDLTPREAVAGMEQEATEEIGKHLYTALGCMACHSVDGTMAEKVGPTWLGLYGSKREFTDGTFVKKADEVYLRESILNPARKVTAGFAGEGVGMPSYLGVLQDYQIDSIILYIKSLNKTQKKK